MAKPIKETPVLEGKDAKVFLETIKKNNSISIDPAELKKLQESYKRFSK